MIVISFLPQQGLGNQLWLLFAALSLSKHFNLKFRLHNPQFFKGWKLLSEVFTNNLVCIDYLDPLVNRSFLFPSLFTHESGNLYFPHNLDSFSFLKLYDSIVLEDICQSIHLLEDRNITANYFRKPALDFQIPYDTCVINIRGGDYLGFRKSPAVLRQYYYYAIDQMKAINSSMSFAIVTDDYRYANSIMPEYSIIKGDYMSDFDILRNSHYLILSNSSFAFFPAYISSNLRFAFAPAYWAPSTQSERRSFSWYSPANYYCSLFRYLNPYDGSEINPTVSEYDACLSTLSVAAPLSQSLACTYPSRTYPIAKFSSLRSNILKSLKRRFRANLLYTYLRLLK